jgi:hypothetical protein
MELRAQDCRKDKPATSPVFETAKVEAVGRRSKAFVAPVKAMREESSRPRTIGADTRY